MGFNKPSKIQERALPLLLSTPPRNMIGQSQSGTGKTAAFVLTMLSRIDFSIPTTQAICMAPTRELAQQIMQVVDKMGQYTPVTKFFASKGAQFRGEKIEAQLMVGTVGTFLDASWTMSSILIQLTSFADDKAERHGRSHTLESTGAGRSRQYACTTSARRSIAHGKEVSSTSCFPEKFIELLEQLLYEYGKQNFPSRPILCDFS